MNVLTLSPDGQDLQDPSSPAAQRFIQYGTMADRFDVVIPGQRSGVTQLSPQVAIYSVGARQKLLYLWRLLQTFGTLVRANHYTVLSTRDTYYLGFLAWILASWYGLGLEVQVHGFEKLAGIRARLAHFVLRRAHSIRAVSERLKRKLIQDFSVRPEAIIVSPIFIDCTKIRERQGISSGVSVVRRPFTFLTVGRFVPIKNIALQLEALAKLRTTHQARLLVVGDGPLRTPLAARVQELHLEDAVEFCGTQKDLTPFFASSDCFLLTSHDEGYGMAPIEAACAGLPIIMTDVGCAHETLIDQQNALIIPVNDRDALRTAMQRIIDDTTLRHRMHTESAALCQRLPSLETTLMRYQQSWKLAAQRPARP